MRIRCFKNRFDGIRYDLTLGAEYEVIGIEADDFRVLGDGGDPYLYPHQLFRVVDATRPRHWVTRSRDGAEYAYAPMLGKPGFFEDYFDLVPAARRTFTRYLNRHLRLTSAA